MKQLHSKITGRWTTVAAIDDDVTVFIVSDTKDEGQKKAVDMRRLIHGLHKESKQLELEL